MARIRDAETARRAIDLLLRAGLVVREDMDRSLCEDAGDLKAAHRRVSLADRLGLALARRVGGGFLSTDHHELDPLVPLGLCAIRFIR